MTGLQDMLEQWRSVDSINGKDEQLAVKILQITKETIASGNLNSFPAEFWMEFLDITKKPRFLRALGSKENRERWAESVFTILQPVNYTLRDMMECRVKEHPDDILFRELTSSTPVGWSYEQIYRHIREIATLFYLTDPAEPHVALYTENCLEGACTDLACLCYDIFDTPLNTHFNPEILRDIFDRLHISIAVTDSRERLTLLRNLRGKTVKPFRIFTLSPGISSGNESLYLLEECKKLTHQEIEETLGKRKIHTSNEVATTMFTSGSTGLPKGVSFSVYNIVSKRFARAAAFPAVGGETFLCYLPLFHTFGRYLEMTGAIFWDGTYVFAGNTSAETLFRQFPIVGPTGFISIPLRWQELYERCSERINGIEREELRISAVREVVGQNLRWGLSAAGYLDPSVFRFFNQYGISLCSGFGMTEATGGITMTPPGQYHDQSVGFPLPGIRTRLTNDSELEISGHYIGRYLEDAGPGDVIPYPVSPEKDKWLPTGDVFSISTEGHYQIIDRVKDIYKNNRGQTVAPQIIEKKFINVPGIKSTFVVGDNRPYNVLLISPDKKDPLYHSVPDENLRDYYHQIVTAANSDVAPFERVVNFALTDREFSSENGELTPKGSFNRKTIENNFRDTIELLYISNTITIPFENFTILIPRWFFRDLGALETDIVADHDNLYNKFTDKYLIVKKIKGHTYQIGDFQYTITNDIFDLGVFARQPKLWAGNPALIAFCPIREGWDVPLGFISESIHVAKHKKYTVKDFPVLKLVKDPQLIIANNLFFRSLFLKFAYAYPATDKIGSLIGDVEPRLATVLQRRLETLAYHPEEEIRALAYRILLLKASEPGLIQYMPSFIESGLSFLNERSIREIASGNFGKHRLDALKQRLYWYRTHLKWPAGKKNRPQFEYVLQMLFDFAAEHLEFYVSVRAELSRWILHRVDPYLSQKAEDYFFRLAAIFEKVIEEKTVNYPLAVWKPKMVFEYGISGIEKERITYIFQTTSFLQESIILAFNESGFDLKDLPEGGIWILRLQAMKEFRHYIVSINTISGKHFDLHLVLSENPDFKPKPDTFYWLASLAGFPYGPAVAPFLGSSRPDLGILTTQYISGLTAWDKIREFAEIHKSAGYLQPNAWKKVFVKAFTVIFRAWHHSGFQIVPGIISPANVVVPEMDFRENAVILSLTGWTAYLNTLSLVGPMIRDFYERTSNIYPLSKKQLKIRWVFDACIEALGKEEATVFLNTLKKELLLCPGPGFDEAMLRKELDHYMDVNLDKFYLPLTLCSAIDQYDEWVRMNPLITSAAREQTIFELMELFRLHEFHEPVRYYFYRHSYFAEAGLKVVNAFDKLLEKMQSSPTGTLPIQLVELSGLQSALETPDDKNVFSRMVFPRLQSEQKVDFMKVGERLKEHVVVRFDLKDKAGSRYTFREPLEPKEVGQLYQLFFRENYPKEISQSDNHFVVTDDNEKIIGGLTWRKLDESNILLDGLVVTSSLQGRGIASAMISDFFTQMAARGVKVVKAHFLFGNYYMKHFFEVDEKWGALIKKLGNEE
ncbi:MAG: GNAT family N-acetyltransferase [Bacteroidetes bacterium]|nr:GNAT family N-acetyltransferase [Bacteroidota bacterium]